MEIIWQEFALDLPSTQQVIQTLIRLIAAILCGSIIGYEREKAGKPAGLRTHILVTLGTCAFVVSCSMYGMSSDGLSRVIQGIVTGIGFLGAGSILKLNEQRSIQGLTTAAGIWMTAAIGVAIGLGTIGLALIITVLTVSVLFVLRKVSPTPESVDE